MLELFLGDDGKTDRRRCAEQNDEGNNRNEFTDQDGLDS